MEYDDVMNKQRTVIYTKRNHALFGERLALDLDNAFYDVAESLVTGFKESNDFEGFKLEVIVNFGLDTEINADQFASENQQSLTEKLYREAFANLPGPPQRNHATVARGIQKHPANAGCAHRKHRGAVYRWQAHDTGTDQP